MKKLIRNKFNFSFLLMCLTLGCTHLSYKVLNQDSNKTELLVSPDRILLECEDVQDPTEKVTDSYGRFGFMIHVLDNADTVLTVSQGNVLDKKTCFEKIKQIEKILNNGTQIYIGGMGDLNNPRKKTTEKFTFPGKGSFYSNSRALQFAVIKNEKGECYSAHSGREKPCPRDEFPISKSSLKN